MIAPKLDSGAALGFFWEVFKARPTTFIGLSVWWIAIATAIAVGQIAFLGEELVAMQTMASDSPEYLGVLGAYLGKLALFMLVALAVSVPLETAWLRLFMSGEGNPVFPFRIGAGEGAYLLTAIVIGLVFLAVYLVSVVVVIGVGAALAAAAGEAGALFGVLLGMLLVSALMAFFGVRFSPALALAVHRRRFAFGAAWKGTKAMFWPLLGCFVIAMLIAMVAYMVAMIVFLFVGVNLNEMFATTAVPEWQAITLPYLILYALILIPTCLMRGIACKAALTIEEANAAPPAMGGSTVGRA